MTTDVELEKGEAALGELSKTLEEELTAEQVRLREIEKDMNLQIDTKIAERPDRMPFSIYFIIPNEAAERYCYYGITPIIKNFFKYFMGYSAVDANELYHSFKSVSYVTPLIGAALSDSFLNKYVTIVSLSTVYVIGCVLLSVFAVPGYLGEPPGIPHWGPLLAIFLIAFGTGGIKPCVSAHGGDQFIEIQKQGIEKFYNYFYMAINTGACISSFVSPLVQQNNCYGLVTSNPTLFSGGDCYSVAFAICAGVMFLGLTVFAVGKRFYRVVPPSGKFMPWELMKIGFVFAYKFLQNRSSAYDETSKIYGEGLVVEMLDMAKVFAVLIPSPIFWMAFDQNGSTWQDLGDQMNTSHMFGSQTSEIVNNAVNPIFIIILAPLFANFVYPFMDKHFPGKFGLLQRMVVGMCLAGVSFLVGAGLQTKVDETCEIQDDGSCISSSIHIGWQVLMYFIITMGEVLFSISGLNFTYIEVGRRLKSSCAAIWLLYVSIGDALATALLDGTMKANPDYWTRARFFYLVAGLCFASAVLQLLLQLKYVPKALRATAAI